MPSTKEETITFIAKVKATILAEGNDPLHNAIQIVSLEKVAKALRADPEIRELVVNELDKYTEKMVKVGTSEVEKAETGIKYDFQGDHVLVDLLAQEKAIKEKIKERQAFIKTIKGEVYGEDGIQVLPAVRSSTSNYKITIK